MPLRHLLMLWLQILTFEDKLYKVEKKKLLQRMNLTFPINVLKIFLKCYRFNVGDTNVLNILLKYFYNVIKMFHKLTCFDSFRWYNIMLLKHFENVLSLAQDVLRMFLKHFYENVSRKPQYDLFEMFQKCFLLPG